MTLGMGSYTNTDLPHNVAVGNYSSIAKDCVFHLWSQHLCEKDRRVVFTTKWEQPQVSIPITIGSDVWIGEAVRVLEGVTIGDGAIVGAGAVIAKDVPAFAVVVGNPQVIKRYRFKPKQIKKLLQIKWWEWDEETVLSRRKAMKDIKVFLATYGV